MKYTVGKWQIRSTGTGKFEIIANERIAIVDNFDDAMLIVMSPRMWDTLESIRIMCVGALDDYREQKRVSILTNVLTHIRRQAENVIAKAEVK